MKWEGRRGSDNLEDRRSSTGTAVAGGGVGALILMVVVWLLGGDPGMMDQFSESGGTQTEYVATAKEDSLVRFISVVLADTEEIWSDIFRKNGMTYRKPKLVVFNHSISSACGNASSATGPFYCPADEKVYIDVSFYDEMKRNYNAKGEFALAYVVAHEVGHHVQKLMGTLDKERQISSGLSQKEANKIQVRIELQADFYAGIWAHYQDKFFGRLDARDIKDAMDAAAGVGDDRIQQQSQGRVVPDSFTHGTSAQRSNWFYKGYQTGDIRQGDTFSGQI